MQKINIATPFTIFIIGLAVASLIFVWQSGILAERFGELRAQKIKVEVLDTDPVLGVDSAPVTIIEFGDLECPFCQKFSLETLPEIVKNEIAQGRVRLVWKDFPLSTHARAEKAHEAARCAQDQGRFWEYHDLLYRNQRALEISALKQYATTLGLDQTLFDQCLDSGQYKGLITEGIAQGVAAGVRGTPSFLINGKLVVGAQPYEVFKKEISNAL